MAYPGTPTSGVLATRAQATAVDPTATPEAPSRVKMW